MKKKPGPKPKDHVRFEMRVTEKEKEKCIAFYEQLKKDRICNEKDVYSLEKNNIKDLD